MDDENSQSCMGILYTNFLQRYPLFLTVILTTSNASKSKIGPFLTFIVAIKSL